MNSIKSYIVFLCVLLMASMSAAFANDGRYHSKIDIVEMVVEEALALDYPPEMALAVAKVSSNFKVNYIGFDGRLGVMQVSPVLASRYGVSKNQICKPRSNIRVGIKYLQDLEVEYGAVDAGLNHYLGGESSIVGDSFVSNRAKRFTRKVMEYSWRYQDHGLIARIREGLNKEGVSLVLGDEKELLGSCFSKRSKVEYSAQLNCRKNLIRYWESVYEK